MGVGLQSPLPVGQGGCQKPGVFTAPSAAGVTGTGLSLVRGGHRPGGAEHGRVASANKDPHSHFLWF